MDQLLHDRLQRSHVTGALIRDRKGDRMIAATLCSIWLSAIARDHMVLTLLKRAEPATGGFGLTLAFNLRQLPAVF
ncbi:hypothetical protein CKA34_02085 [Rhizobium sp. 11515TR]|nr:hypothetical protein CKA34_02085 [Rhizobium sp. 11515TR]